MKFSDIIGQDEIKRRLIDCVREQRVPHAQLFTGQSGVGKLQLAVAFAQYLACPNRTETDSCGHCPSCQQYQQLQHPDLHFVFPVLKTGSTTPISDDYINDFRKLLLNQHYFDENEWFSAISGDEAKVGYIYERESQEIIKKLSFKSYSSEFKVMIIWLPERMYGDVCANKLLKLLEEPPEKTLFILVSERPERLLPTIISRTQQLRIPRLSEQEIAKGLRSINPDAEMTTILNIAHIADGSFFKAKQMLDESAVNQLYLQQFIELMRCAYTIGSINDPTRKYKALSQIRQWSEMMGDKKVGREARIQFLQYCQRMIRENFVLNVHNDKLNYMTTAEKQFSNNFSRFINENNVEDIMSELATVQRQIEQNGNARIIFFDFCLKMIVYIKRNT